MEGYQTEEDLVNKFQELAEKRHQLGDPHNGDLKALEEPINYVLDNLSDGLDPLHAIQLYDEAFNGEEAEYNSIHEILGGKNYEWKNAVDEVEGTNKRMKSHLPSPEELRNNPEEAIKKIDEDMIRGNTSEIVDDINISDYVSRKINDKASEYLPIDDYIRSDPGLEEAYQDWVKKFDKFATKITDMHSAAIQLKGGAGHMDEERIKQMEEQTDIFFMDVRRNPEEYKGLEASLPTINPALPFEMARVFLDEYEERIEEVEERIDDSSPEFETVEVTETERELTVDWEELTDKPDYEKEIVETAAKFQKQSGVDVDAELLGAIVADANEAEVDYSEEIKGANGKPGVDTTIGDIKNSIGQAEELDFVLPVMEKNDELKRYSREIDRAVENLKWEENEMTKKERKKVT